ncbi:fumarylacetoacetate hydrolase family protein [Leucobacter sp. W1038]|uniref:fumarylacetoacetate hydrolase family protein n=1 Tax=Leucobacter sp. W1038 TaxID=3438281 RepID=UPI003D9A0590
MKLVTYRSGTEDRAGVVSSEGVVCDLEFALQRLGLTATRNAREFLELYGGDLAGVEQALRAVDTTLHRVGLVDELELLSPIADPEKVLCVGLNYLDHVAETERNLPKFPDVFAKLPRSLTGPRCDIPARSITDQLDFEGEIAIVIGRSGRSIPEDSAHEHIAGFTVLNDITARDVQYRGTQWTLGKSLDASTPCGPCLVTTTELDVASPLEVITRLNGTEMQRSHTGLLIFSFARIVSYLSTYCELAPGDIIATGTPAGIGAKRVPPVWLQPGDVIEVEVQDIGVLRNSVIE